MSRFHPQFDDPTTPEIVLIDCVCNDFESSLGGRPVIESYLDRVSEDLHPVLLRELLLLELEARMKRGESPDIRDYEQRFPAHADVVSEAVRVAWSESKVDQPTAAMPASTDLGTSAKRTGAATHTKQETTRGGRRLRASSTDPEVQPLRRFGDYELLDEIARGGMGVVFRARQLSLNRIAALKMVLAGTLASEEAIARFMSEAEAAAQLDHPGIVPIYEVGQEGEEPFFSMGYVDGPSLAGMLALGPLTANEAARMIGKISEAVEYAHQHGVIHRDLKPSNILVDESGRPRITDFGLAKLDGADQQLTTTGQVIGTPGYMPPEQALGDEVDERADVYAMGALLYAQLTGRPPHQAATAVDTLRAVVEREPVAPRRLVRGVPRDLETICLKAISKNPARRYQTASEFLNDITRFENRQPIIARRVSGFEKSLLWARRNPRISALLATIACVVLFASGALLQQSRVVARARDDAEQRLGDSQRNEYLGWITQAKSHYQLGNLDAMRTSLDACLAIGEVDLRGWEWHYLDALNNRALRTFAAGEPGEWCYAMQISPDQRWLATGAGAPHFVSTTADSEGRLRLWDIESGQLVREFNAAPPLKAIRAIAFAPNGEELATCEMNWAGGQSRRLIGPVRIWDTVTGQMRQLLSVSEPVFELNYSDDGEYLIGRTRGARKRPSRLLLWKREAEGFVAVTQQPAWLASRQSPNTLPLITPRPNASHSLWADLVNSDRTAAVFDRTGQLVRTYRSPNGKVESIAFHPDGTRLAIANTRSMVEVLYLADDRRTLRLVAHSGPITHTSFNQTGELLLTGGWDGLAKIWDATQSPEYLKIEGLLHQPEVCVDDLAFAGDDELIAVRSNGGQFRRFDTRTGRVLQSAALPLAPEPHGRRRLTVFSGNGRLLASRDPVRQDRIRTWETSGLVEMGEFVLRDSAIQSIALGHDARVIAAHGWRGEESQLGIWEVESSRPCDAPAARMLGRLGRVTSLVVGPRDWVALGSSQPNATSLLLWNHETKSSLTPPVDRPVFAVAFSSDAKRVAAATDTELFCWTLPELELTFSTTLSDRIEDLAFFADETRIAGTSRERTLIWESMSGRPVIQLEGRQRTFDLAFPPRVRISPNNRLIAANQWEDTINIWQADPQNAYLAPVSELLSDLRGDRVRQLMDKRRYASALPVIDSQLAVDEDPQLRLFRAAALKNEAPNQANEDFRQAVTKMAPENRAMLFGASKFYVEGDGVPFDEFEEFTMEAWVNGWAYTLLSQGTTGDPENSIYMVLGGHGFGWESGVGKNFEYPVGPHLGSGWRHVAMVYAGGRQQIYVDGQLISSREGPSPGPLKDRPLRIGNHAGERKDGFGLVRSVRISRIARYQTDFEPADRWPIDEATVRYYDFTQATETEVPDLANKQAPARIVTQW